MQIKDLRPEPFTKRIRCDRCGHISELGDAEFQETVCIDLKAGYGSIFGDGNDVQVDLCGKPRGAIPTTASSPIELTEPTRSRQRLGQASWRSAVVQPRAARPPSPHEAAPANDLQRSSQRCYEPCRWAAPAAALSPTSERPGSRRRTSGRLVPDSLGFDHFDEALDAKAVRVKRPGGMTCLILSGPVRVVGPGKQALGIVEEVTIVAKRDQHLLDRDLQEAGEALVVALDAGVDDPAMLLLRGRRLGQAERSAELQIRADSL